jgi:Cu(I)/Ag(I) efflux system membrane protein CusA/SilA
VSSTLLTLIVIPAVYAIIKGWSFKKAGTAPDLALGQAAE